MIKEINKSTLSFVEKNLTDEEQYSLIFSNHVIHLFKENKLFVLEDDQNE